jgi:hypothetical protein
MKTLNFVIEQPRRRAHRALFDRELPFRARREQPKNQYQRRVKNRRQLEEWID